MITPQEIGITSCTYANEGEKSSKMGRKNIVPYALYRVDGFISPSLASKKQVEQAFRRMTWSFVGSINQYVRF